MVRIQNLKLKIRLLVIAVTIFLQEDVSAKNVGTPYHRTRSFAAGVVLQWPRHLEKKGIIVKRPSVGRYHLSPGVGKLGPHPACHLVSLGTRQLQRPRHVPVALGTQVPTHHPQTRQVRSRHTLLLLPVVRPSVPLDRPTDLVEVGAGETQEVMVGAQV